MSSPTLLVKGSLSLSDKAKMAKANRDLPINYIISWIKKRMPEYGYNKANLEDRILIVRAETGSGKSTVLPVELFRILRNKDTPLSEKYTGKLVICTQPRVLTAIALANDVSGRPWNPDIILGKTVGYQTGPTSNKPEGGLLYATAGVLSMQFENYTDIEIMDTYKFIIIDEAHERSQECDLLIMLLKNFYIRNRGNINLPFMLLSSATFDINKYAKYFDINSEDNTVEILGRTYPIITHWPRQESTESYIQQSINITRQIHEDNYSDSPNKCDILIFVPGIKQIDLIKLGLDEINKEYELEDSKYSPFLILTINRDNINSQTKDFNLMFIRPSLLPKVFNKQVKRRIIIATIVAETGITVDTLKYVIDCGWNKSTEVYQPWGIFGLITRPAPMSKIKQRRGRVGRLFPGEFYPLYTEAVYNSLEEQQLPDFITMGIKDKFLSMVQIQQKQKIYMKTFPDFKVEDMSLLDMPSMESFIMANALANLLGFVSEEALLPKKWPPNFSSENIFEIETGYGLTQLGHIAANIKSLGMESIKMILLSYVYDISIEDIVNINAIISIDKIFTIEETKKKEDTPAGTKALLESIPNCKKLCSVIKTLKKDNSSEGSNSKFFGLDMQLQSYIIIKLFFSDTFIELLFIFENFIKMISTEISADISNWCIAMGLDYTNLSFALTRRNEIIDELYFAGIDPFRNEQFKINNILLNFKDKQDIPILLNTIKSIKKCIYGGFFNNILTLNPDDNSYYNNQGFRVKLNSPFIASKIFKLFSDTEKDIEYKPKWIVSNKIELVAISSPDPTTPAPLLYSAQVKIISVLDGFIYPDLEFGLPKISFV
jgi:HrpA-like RNA helicase